MLRYRVFMGRDRRDVNFDIEEDTGGTGLPDKEPKAEAKEELDVPARVGL